MLKPFRTDVARYFRKWPLPDILDSLSPKIFSDQPSLDEIEFKYQEILGKDILG